jgi:hypothetical protein
MRVSLRFDRTLLTVVVCVLVTCKLNLVHGRKAESHTGSSFSAVESDKDDPKGLEECWIAEEIYPVVKCVKQRNTCKGSVTLADSQVCNVCNRGAPE